MTTPGSGNRWEPAEGATPGDTALPPGTGEPPPARPTARPRQGWLRPGRVRRGPAWLVGVAAAFLLLGGLAGLLVGHTTAGHGTEIGRFGQLDHRGQGSELDRGGFGSDGSRSDGSRSDGSGSDGSGPDDGGQR